MKDIAVNEARAWDSLVATRIVDEKRALSGAMLPILYELQETSGYIAGEADMPIAEALSVSRAELHRDVIFYPDVRLRASAAHNLGRCRAEACRSRDGGVTC